MTGCEGVASVLGQEPGPAPVVIKAHTSESEPPKKGTELMPRLTMTFTIEQQDPVEKGCWVTNKNKKPYGQER